MHIIMVMLALLSIHTVEDPSPIAIAHWLSNSPMAPGEEGFLVINVINPNNSPMLNVTVSLNSTIIKPARYINSTPICTIPIIPPYGNSTCIIYVAISPTVSLGIYAVPVMINYSEITGLPLRPTLTSSSTESNITVPILGYVGFEASAFLGNSQGIVNLVPGSYVPITLYLSNYGNTPASNVTIIVSAPPQIYIINPTIRLPQLPPGQALTVPLQAMIKSYVEPGVYSMNLTICYFNDQCRNITTNVVVPGMPQVYVQSIYTNPPEIFEGYSMVALQAYVINSGVGAAYNTTVTLEGAATLNSNPIMIGTLPPGQPVPITFLIRVPGSPGNYTLRVRVNYRGSYVVRDYILNVNPKARIDVINVTYPEPPQGIYSILSITGTYLSPGASGVPITFTIINRGNVSADNLVVTLSSSQVIQPHVSSNNPLSALTASRIFVGDLKPGQSVNITFVVDVDSSTIPGRYPLILSMIWNQSGSIYPLTDSAIVYVYVGNSQNPIIYVIAALIVAVAIIGAIAGIRRRRRGVAHGV